MDIDWNAIWSYTVFSFAGVGVMSTLGAIGLSVWMFRAQRREERKSPPRRGENPPPPPAHLRPKSPPAPPESSSPTGEGLTIRLAHNVLDEAGVFDEHGHPALVARIQMLVEQRDFARHVAEDACWMMGDRCHACGHRLARSASHCPQCEAKARAPWHGPRLISDYPDKCECDRCVGARKVRTEP